MKRALAVLCVALALAAPAAAQDFPGYPPSGYLPIGQGAGVPYAWVPNPGLLIANNLNDVANVAAARGNLGLGSIATQNANAVAISGGTITGIAQPTVPGDVATKLYVDSVGAGVVVHPAVRLATAAALPTNVYNNGAAGVGATLTASANAALSVDGVAVASGDRINVKNEPTAANNGLYTVTNTGSAGTLWVLTRATDANSPGTGNPAKLGIGTFALATAGNTLANTGWQVNSAVGAIGTDAVNWVQYSATTSGVVSVNTLTGALALVGGQGINVNPSGTNITLSGALPRPQGRLTLLTHTPVMTTNQLAKSTIFYDCYRGGAVPVFNGTQDVLLPIPSCEASMALQASGTGVVNASQVFDVWAINVANVLHLCVATNGSGLGWAGDTGGSNTVRGSGYAAIDNFSRPYMTNAAGITNCYEGATQRGPLAANQASYLGTFWTTAAGQTAFSLGVNGAPPSPACICIWNADNRLPAGGQLTDTRSSWQVAQSTWREADGPNNNGTYRWQAVTGLPDDLQSVTYSNLPQSVANNGNYAEVAICFNVTNAPTTAALGGGHIGGSVNSTTSQFSQAHAAYMTHANGFNFFSACEAASGDGQTANMFGRPWSSLDYLGAF